MEMPEPMGKLDTVEVNGPEGEVLDWDAVDWRRVEDDVRRLRQRIFTATQEGDLKKVRNLQKLMLRSRANALCSVRRVTEHTPSAACQTALPVRQYSAAPTDAFWACLSGLPGTGARPVLRGPRRGDAWGLPDWKPFYYLLEDLPGVEVMLVNARHVKNLPGRKTDLSPTQPGWLSSAPMVWSEDRSSPRAGPAVAGPDPHPYRRHP